MMTIELWCLFFTGLLHLLTKIPLIKAQVATDKGYDNNNPRQQQAALTGFGSRALAAHENQIESFPLFAAGILVATVTGVTSVWVSYLAVLFVIARLAFFYLYLKDIASARSFVWLVGYFSTLALLLSPLWG